jgi:hypothetical protein
MISEQPVDPNDWESQALFPARLLMGFPAEVRQKLQQAGADLYLMILEGLKESSEPPGSQVARDLRSLMAELMDLVKWAEGVTEAGAVTASLREILDQASEAMIALGHEPLPDATDGVPAEPWDPLRALRPFLREMVKDLRHRRGLANLATGLAAAAPRPTPGQWLEALALDLGWIQTVLERHIAPRGEISALESGDSALCRLAGRLGEGLQRPLEELSQIVRLASLEEATAGAGG